MMFAIKAEISNPQAETFAFNAQKTMYGGKHIVKGDTIFVFASENEGGPGLIASGVVTLAKAIPKKCGIARQTPRVSINVERIALAKRRLRLSALNTHAHCARDAHSDRQSSNSDPTDTTVDPKPSSISNSIVRQRTRSSASRMKRRHSSADYFRERIYTI